MFSAKTVEYVSTNYLSEELFQSPWPIIGWDEVLSKYQNVMLILNLLFERNMRFMGHSISLITDKVNYIKLRYDTI